MKTLNKREKVKIINKKELNPKVILDLIGENESKKWEATFCKILISNKCPSYSLYRGKDGIIHVEITNKYGYKFKTEGSEWSFICIMLAKYMKSYFELENEQERLAKVIKAMNSLTRGKA